NYDQSFTFFYSLVWVVLVITAGARLVQAAIIGGVTFFIFPALLDKLCGCPGNYLASHPETTGFVHSFLSWFNPSWAQGVAFILFGFGALTYAKHPEGIIEAQGAAASARMARLFSGRRGKAESEAGTPSDSMPPDVNQTVDVVACPTSGSSRPARPGTAPAARCCRPPASARATRASPR